LQVIVDLGGPVGGGDLGIGTDLLESGKPDTGKLQVKLEALIGIQGRIAQLVDFRGRKVSVALGERRKSKGNRKTEA
jgi:hypothetical protein